LTVRTGCSLLRMVERKKSDFFKGDLLSGFLRKISLKRIRRLLFAAFWILIALPGPCPAVRAEGFSLVASDRRRIEVDFELPDWGIEALEVDGKAFSVIRAGGSAELRRAGFPAVPEYKAVLAVPPGVSAAVRWQAGPAREISVPLPLPPQPAQDSEAGDRDQPTTITTYSPEFHSAAAYPANSVQVRGPQRFRDLMLLELLVRPFACLPAGGGLRVTSGFRITVELTERADSPLPPPAGGGRQGRVFENVCRDVLLNYESSKTWRIPGGGGNAELSSTPFTEGDNWASLRIDKSDMYAISPGQLSAAGIGVEAIDPATFRLFTGGGRMLSESLSEPEPALTEVAIQVSGSGDGSFDPGDRIIFFGQGLDRFTVDDTGRVSSIRHRYDNLAVYWLTWGDPGVAALRMNEYDSPPPAGVTPAASAEIWYHWEENTVYLALEDILTYINPAPDYWAWKLDTDGNARSERPFELGKKPEERGHFFRCQFYGSQYRRFIDYSFAVNGTELGSGRNFHYKAVTSDWIPVPGGLLRQGENLFSLAGEGQVPGFFELRVNTGLTLEAGERLIFHQPNAPSSPSYELSASVPGTALFDITDPLRPERIVLLEPAAEGRVRFGARSSGSTVRSFAAVASGAYAVPEQVRAERFIHLRNLPGFEYLIVSPKILISHAAKLAALRSDQYRAGVVTVEDIYNEFSFGQADPGALRNFLRYALESWSVAPEFVVLFGDGHNDFRGYTAEGRSKSNHILPYIDASDVALDEWFVRVTDSNLPQIMLGRIPVLNSSEAAVVVDKIIKYGQAADAGDWLRRVVLVADDGYVLGGKCDPVTNHVGGNEQLDSLFPADMERKKVYLQQYPFDPPGIGTRKPAATAELISWWNRGALIINYFGHGSDSYWAQERVFDVERDLPMLTNGYRLPLVLNASCSIGHFDAYNREAMAERVLTYQGGGAVAAYAATRITYAGRNLELSKIFVDALFAEGGREIGAAAITARIAVGGIWDIGNAQRYSIFGDPALRLHVPGRRLRFELGQTASLRVGDKLYFTGMIEDESGSLDANFSGVAQVKFLGGIARPLEIDYECRQNNALKERSVGFTGQPTVLFDGPVTVTTGRFSGALVLPLNLAGSLPVDTLNLESGRFVGYATSEITDGAGVSASLTISRRAGELSDTSAPRISLLSRGRELSDGDRVSISEPLLLVLSDENGINTTGSPGVQLSLEVDEGTTYAADLTPLFRYHQDSYQEGTVPIDLAQVGTGLHALRIRATDNLLNSASAEWMLQLAGAAGGLTLSGVMNYPNPFRDQTDICFEVSAPADVLVRIFTVAGRPVRELRSYGVAAGFNAVRWDGTDEYKQKIANGVYIYKIICKPLTDISQNTTEEVEAVGKALLSR